MDIQPIKTEQDYRWALREIEGLMMAEPGSLEGDRLDVLATLVEAYETKHYPLELPDPVEAIRYAMEQHQLSAKDMEPFIGQSSRVHAILNRQRPLTLRMIWKLHTGLGIPAASLIRPAGQVAHSGAASN